MKQFCRNIINFIIAVTFIFVIADLCISLYLRNLNKTAYCHWTEILYDDMKADVLILGSSRAWVQYDSQILEDSLGLEVYNMGMEGCPINRQLDEYLIYRELHGPVKLLILNIDYMFTTLGVDNEYRREQYFPYFWNSTFRRITYGREYFSPLEKYLPLYRYMHLYSYLKSLSIEPSVFCTKGALLNNQTWDGRDFYASDISSDFYEYTPDPQTLFDFYKLLSVAQEDGTKVVLVMAPIYYELTERMRKLDDYYVFYKELSVKKEIDVIDYMSSEICSDTVCFYNAVHLNQYGSQIFTSQLASDLKNLADCNERYIIKDIKIKQ